jgi:hypothetical protein
LRVRTGATGCGGNGKSALSGGTDVGTSPANSWGRRTGRPTRRWRLVHAAGVFTLTGPEGVDSFTGRDLDRLRVGRSRLRNVLCVSGPEGERRLTGLSKYDRLAIGAALEAGRARTTLDELLDRAVPWAARAQRITADAVAQGRWISSETTTRLSAERPPLTALGRTRRRHRGGPAGARREGTRRPGPAPMRPRQWIAGINESILESELQRRRGFFDKVETSPLTDEQARGVVSFDNRVNLIASAGSGKTSVMVARAAYAIDRGFVASNRILLLAFNKNAAVELKERVERRLTAVGLSAEGVTATTFRAFGLGLIGKATGRKPRLASWLEFGQPETLATAGSPNRPRPHTEGDHRPRSRRRRRAARPAGLARSSHRTRLLPGSPAVALPCRAATIWPEFAWASVALLAPFLFGDSPPPPDGRRPRGTARPTLAGRAQPRVLDLVLGDFTSSGAAAGQRAVNASMCYVFPLTTCCRGIVPPPLDKWSQLDVRTTRVLVATRAL